MAQESWKCDSAEGSGCQQQEGIVLCSNNCGSSGCAATMNLCPKCFRDLTLKKKQGNPSFSSHASSDKVAVAMAASSIVSMGQSTSVLPENTFNLSRSVIAVQSVCDNPSSTTDLVESASSVPSHCANISLSDLAPIAALFSSEAKDLQLTSRRPNANRCLMCRKRTGLLGFKCRCGNVFCAQHRYSDKHGCPYDYKSAGREAIAKANPLVKAKKVEKI